VDLEGRGLLAKEKTGEAMTTTKVCCDGCGKVAKRHMHEPSSSDHWKEVFHKNIQHDLPSGIPPEHSCHECWEKMKEALKDVEP